MRNASWYVVSLLLVCLVALGGCTQGQMAPQAEKDCLYAARADGIVSLDQSAAILAGLPADAPDSTKATAYKEAYEILHGGMVRIVGTKEQSYENGFLSPLKHYFLGTKPKATATP